MRQIEEEKEEMRRLAEQPAPTQFHEEEFGVLQSDEQLGGQYADTRM